MPSSLFSEEQIASIDEILIPLKLDEESIREVIDGSSYEEWDIEELNKLVYESLNTHFQSIETDYLDNQKGSD